MHHRSKSCCKWFLYKKRKEKVVAFRFYHTELLTDRYYLSPVRYLSSVLWESSLLFGSTHTLLTFMLLSWIIKTLFQIMKVPTNIWDLAIEQSKGQLILICLFVIFNSSKKRTKKFDLPNYLGTSSRIVFICFLEELKTPKRHFEINWPLSSCCH